MIKTIVIVGGVAAGASCAARLRRLDETARIIMFEKDEYISFANCGLPYHIGDVITERSRLIVQTPAAMKRRFNLDVRPNSMVVSVDPAAKTVTVNSKENGEYQEKYDTLVLAPGVEPIRPKFPNGAPERTYSLRTIPDTDRIKAAIVDGEIKTAAILGGGFIGVEMAECLRAVGVEVTLIEAAPHILPPFDSEMSVLCEKELKSNGVKLFLNAMVESIAGADNAAALALSNGETVEAEIVISSIGVRPATDFLAGSGVTLGPKGHILTDANMRTNISDIYAAGDATEVEDFVTKTPTAVPLAGPANKQGRIAADNIAGIDRRYNGTQGTAVIKVFGLTAACTGANERTLRRMNIPFVPVYSHPFSHATYYPGSVQMACKLLMSPEDGTILGCQIVGAKGAEKRLDVVATAMRLGAKAPQLAELELSYAPPFSSAKDPVNMLGYIAENILEGRSNLVDHNYVLNRDTETTVLLDVRTPDEYARGHIDGAVNIPVDELRERLGELDKSRQIIEYCQVGVRAHVAERILKNNGFNVVNMSGGWKTWSSIYR